MTDDTALYYVLSTIPQVLVAYLGLTGIFLIQLNNYCEKMIIAQAKLSLKSMDSMFLNHIFSSSEYTTSIKNLTSGIGSKSVSIIKKEVNFLLELIDKKVNQLEDEQNKNQLLDEKEGIKENFELINQTTLLFNSTIPKIMISFYIGFPTILGTLLMIFFVPTINKTLIDILSLIFLVASAIAIAFMSLVMVRGIVYMIFD